MGILLTTNGLHVLVDDADLPSLIQYRWFGKRARSKVERFYVSRGRLSGEQGPQTIYLHRSLLQPAAGLEVDHINGDGLDNRRCNLRVATKSQNNANWKVTATGVSGFRGVQKYKRGWRAQVAGKISRGLGPSRRTAVHAAFDYDKIARRLFGEFATLNFPCAAIALGEGERS